MNLTNRFIEETNRLHLQSYFPQRVNLTMLPKMTRASSKYRFVLIIIFLFIVSFPLISYFKPSELTVVSILLSPNSSELKIGNISQDDLSLVQYVKDHILVPPAPKNQPYTYSKPQMLATNENPSQYKQNLLVLEILKQINKHTNGFFIECGALDGVYLSNTLYFEQNFNWTGLLIEVHPDFFNTLKSVNRKAWIANACLSMKPHPELMDLHLAPITGVHSLIHNSKHHISNKTIKAQCIPFYTFLLGLGVQEIEYFSLDVEGAEWSILQTIPFDKIKFLVIEVEVDYIFENKPLIKAFLESKGYVLYRFVYPDYIFIHESLKDRVGNATLP